MVEVKGWRKVDVKWFCGPFVASSLAACKDDDPLWKMHKWTGLRARLGSDQHGMSRIFYNFIISLRLL